MMFNSLYSNVNSDMFNEATREIVEDDSSSAQFSMLVFSITQRENDITKSSVVDSSIEQLDNSIISESNRIAIKWNVIDEEMAKDKLVEELTIELEDALKLFGDENEDFSSAERKIINIEHMYNMRILGEVIQNVYVHHYDEPLYLMGICKSLLRYDLVEVQPWGAAILAGLINHPNENVKEYTVQLIDNWCDIELLPILKTLEVSSQWLKDYISDVVDNLERENVLYQKTIKTKYSK